MDDLIKLDIATHPVRPIPVEAVRRLYDDAGWWPRRSRMDIAQVLATGTAIGAWDEDTLVGFARAVTDGPARAYVEDVVVVAPYQRRGVGSLLLTHLLDELAHVETISLFCTADLVPFYEAHGFHPTMQVVMHRPRGYES